MKDNDVSTMHFELLFDVDSRWHVDWRWQGQSTIPPTRLNAETNNRSYSY